MGLDMYLTKNTYVKNWDYEQDPEKKWSVSVKRGGKAYIGVKPERIREVVEEVGYWRKANQIHKWFVDNVQEGNDDCGTYYVSREQLQELLDLCKEVKAASELVEGEVVNGYTYKGSKEIPIVEKGKFIKDPAVAKELLPRHEGFFFGGTGYDQWYMQDIEETIKILESALLEEEGEFFYYSSW